VRSALLRGSQLRASRKQPFLLFNAHASVDAFQDNAGGDLGELFGLDFVEASAAGWRRAKLCNVRKRSAELGELVECAMARSCPG